MKKLMSFLAALAILITVPGSAIGEETWALRDDLIRKAQELSERMSILARSDAVVGLYSGGSSEISETIESIAAYDYAQPTEALVVVFDDALIEEVVDLCAAQGIELPEEAWFPDAMKMKMYNLVPTLLNGLSGTTWMAACSILYTSDVFVLEGAEGSVGWVFLSYPGDQPSVAVSFCIVDDAATLASATYVKLPDDLNPDGTTLIEGALSTLGTIPEEISQSLSRIRIDSLSGEELAEVLEK